MLKLKKAPFVLFLNLLYNFKIALIGCPQQMGTFALISFLKKYCLKISACFKI